MFDLRNRDGEVCTVLNCMILCSPIKRTMINILINGSTEMIAAKHRLPTTSNERKPAMLGHSGSSLVYLPTGCLAAARTISITI